MKVSLEVLAERLAVLQKEVEALKAENAELKAWKASAEKTTSKVVGAIMGVTALATAIAYGFEKAVHKFFNLFAAG